MPAEYRLSGPEKVAVLLLTLREEVAQGVLQLLLENLPQNLVQRIMKYAGMLRDVPHGTVIEIKQEFCEVMRQANALSLGGTREMMRDLLGGFMSPAEVEKLTLDLEEDTDQTDGLEALKWMAPDTIASFLRNEHPQTIALVLGHLEANHAAQVLARLRPNIQPEVIQRLSTLDRVAPKVLEDLNQVLKEELISAASATTEVLGGSKNVAEILNNVDKNTETTILESIEEVNPSLVEEIRELMFTFEDLAVMDQRGMQEITRNVANDQLVLALRGASDEIKEKFFNSVSSRAGERMREELEVMGPVRISEVEEAQQEIVKLARRLADEGKIVLDKGGGEVLV